MCVSPCEKKEIMKTKLLRFTSFFLPASSSYLRPLPFRHSCSRHSSASPAATETARAPPHAPFVPGTPVAAAVRPLPASRAHRLRLLPL